MKSIFVSCLVFLSVNLLAEGLFVPGKAPANKQLSFGGDERSYQKEVSKKIKENGKSKRIKVKETFTQGAEIKDMTSSSDGSIYLTGFIHAESSIPKAGKVHKLSSGKIGEFSTFAAKMSADASQIEWFAVMPEKSMDPSKIVIASNGSIYVGGQYKEGLSTLKEQHESSNYSKSKIAILKLANDGSKLEWIRTGGPNQSKLTGMCADKKGNIVWTGEPSGQMQASYVIKMDPTGTYLNWNDAGKDGKPSWTIYLHDNDVQIKEKFTPFYTKGDKEGYDYDGPWQMGQG